MPDRPIPLFLNPFAGRGRARKRMLIVLKVLRDQGIDCELIESSGQGAIESGIRHCAGEGYEKIIVAGGDGSVHEAVNGILSAGKETALGIIPAGTGNDFCKAIDVPRSYEDATHQLADRINRNVTCRLVDAGRMNDRFFANGVGIGFDAKINRIARSIRLPIGSLVYLLAIFRGVREGLLTPNVRMKFQDQLREGPILFANISNGPWLGGMFHIAPMARVDDGHLDLLVVDALKKRRALTLVPDLMQGRHINAPEVSWYPIRHFTLFSDSPLPSHLDGEVQPLQSRFEIEILPGALHLV